jgi:aminoglycoside phosphotransferase family enzyme/predicted kinase
MFPADQAVAVHETHASWVFVAGERSYKIKKPVALGFLNYTTLELRRAACREEVRVNAALAPGLYLGVRGISRAGEGYRLSDKDAPDVIEYAVEMVSFREQDTLASVIEAGALAHDDVVAIARVLADFHRDAAVVDHWSPAQVSGAWKRNVDELRVADHPSRWDLDGAAAFGDAFVSSHAREMQERARAGLVRDGHGDLRCDHVLTRPSIRVIDRIEFDPRLRRIDVASDIAFLAMDLEARGQRPAARELVEAYEDAGMSAGPDALRAFYAAHWALVRAKVAVISAMEHAPAADAADVRWAEHLWSLSELLCWRARAPVALLICGPPASGKSTLAKELSRRSALPIVSSDETRKRLAGIGPDDRARQEHYSESYSHATYSQLGREAMRRLSRGPGVIVDATCRSRVDRGLMLQELAPFTGPLVLVRLDVPPEVALERAERRQGDPERISDATPEIVRSQYPAFEAFEHDEGELIVLDAVQPLDGQVAEVTGRVDRLIAARV